jgi:hypothetical protein
MKLDPLFLVVPSKFHIGGSVEVPVILSLIPPFVDPNTFPNKISNQRILLSL